MALHIFCKYGVNPKNQSYSKYHYKVINYYSNLTAKISYWNLSYENLIYTLEDDSNVLHIIQMFDYQPFKTHRIIGLPPFDDSKIYI